jgi:hypothetical protein
MAPITDSSLRAHRPTDRHSGTRRDPMDIYDRERAQPRQDADRAADITPTLSTSVVVGSVQVPTQVCPVGIGVESDANMVPELQFILAILDPTGSSLWCLALGELTDWESRRYSYHGCCH